MRNFSLLAAWLILALATNAQESRPTTAPTVKKATKPQAEKLRRDPAAIKFYEKITGALYRPREHGLTAVQFHFLVKIALPDGRKMDFGPYQVDWHIKTGHKITTVGEWKKGMVKPEQMSSNFIEEMINDFVGWDTSKLIKGRHIALDEKMQVAIVLPKKEKSLTAIRKILLAANKDGRLASQRVLGEKGYPLMAREYDYLSDHKRALVENVRIKAGETRKVKSHTYTEVGEFTFPQKISSYGVEQGTREIFYSSIQALTVAKKASK
ncbi:MAG: hypothetical protein ACI97A_001779 [Planctomycetota bacterium]